MRRATTATAYRQHGLTLIELIIVIVILGALSVVGASIFVDSFTLARTVNSSETSADRARYALERLAREVREVKYDGSTANYSINSIASPATSMTFTRVLTDGTDQAVTADLSSGNLRLSYGTPSVLCSNVTSFSINYLQLPSGGGSDVAATSTSNVRLVVLSLTVTDPTSGQAVTERLRVALRNG